MRSPIGVTDPIFKKNLKKNRKKIEIQKKNLSFARVFLETNENERTFNENERKLIDNQKKLNENEKNFNNFQKFLARSFQP